ncbi:MAG TPA: hypothetical protein VM733_15325 [Thermoanaerobaculia bacterium]|nr:hypothetical protein [Thermoanaerobaculia bacterium]
MRQPGATVVLRAGGTFARHLVAGAVVVVTCIALTIVAYAALLVWAVFTHGGLGGPLTLPVLLVLMLAAAVGAVLLVLMPVVALTEFLCHHLRRTRLLFEIVVSALLLTVSVLIVSLVAGHFRGATPAESLQAGTIAAAILLLLLGEYWWASQAAGWVAGAVMRRLTRR